MMFFLTFIFCVVSKLVDLRSVVGRRRKKLFIEEDLSPWKMFFNRRLNYYYVKDVLPIGHTLSVKSFISINKTNESRTFSREGFDGFIGTLWNKFYVDSQLGG